MQETRCGWTRWRGFKFGIRIRWWRLRERLSWWCWRKWLGKKRWFAAYFNITDKELAEFPRRTGQEPAGIKACGHYHDAVDYDELDRLNRECAVKTLAHAIDADVLRRFTESIAAGRGYLRVEPVDEDSMFITPVEGPLED